MLRSQIRPREVVRSATPLLAEQAPLCGGARVAKYNVKNKSLFFSFFLDKERPRRTERRKEGRKDPRRTERRSKDPRRTERRKEGPKKDREKDPLTH